MESLLTPSAKVRENHRPYGSPLTLTSTDIASWAYWAKQIFGVPLPYFIVLYVLSFFFFPQAILYVLAGFAISFVGYVCADLGSRKKEFRWFRMGFDVPLFLLFLAFAVHYSMFSEIEEPMALLHHVGWILSVYLLAYYFDLFPGLNRIAYFLIAAAVVYSVFLITQGYFDFSPTFVLLGLEPPSWLRTNLLQDQIAPALLLAMSFPFALTGWIFATKQKRTASLMMFLSMLIIATALILSRRMEAWLATLGSCMFIIFYARKYLVFTGACLALVATFFFSQMYLPSFWTENRSFSELNSQQRRDLLKSDLHILNENIWFGIGFKNYQLESAKLKAPASTADKASSNNNYFQILATMGVVGFAFYMLSLLSCLLFTARVWNDVPPTYYWHRVLLLGIFGSQITFHLAGLFFWTFESLPLLYLYAFNLGLLGYVGEAYGRGLVPDDHCL